MKGLRGRVVLIDFWTYSCINCLRTLPHSAPGTTATATRADDRRRPHARVRVRARSVECAREREAARVRYPVALDNDFGTWEAWHNQYWPAKYLIDRNGHVRYFHFGEGEYGTTEDGDPHAAGSDAPAPSGLVDDTPHGEVTPESYLGYKRLASNGGDTVVKDEPHAYAYPGDLLGNELAYNGRWTIEGERAVAGPGAGLRLQYRARDVYLVLTGKGSVQVLVDGKPERTVRVNADRLYTLVERSKIGDHLLELHFSPGVAGYAFTFG